MPNDGRFTLPHKNGTVKKDRARFVPVRRGGKMRPMKLPKLHLRDLFWLVLVCAVAVGWWIERGRPKRESEMWQRNAAYWRRNAEQLAKDIRDRYDDPDPIIFDGVPPTP